uniref:Uncharacterized protein ycf23 n=1 Tax=Bulboplastis apyrenoidosa TaxID=1070855 RepID=A0A1Y9TMA2_9RHOD|nr:conserved hypothetical plastid protein [Bulboplastis apyrenoidosa]ARO90800.1 conserved hypothetical plastid protein [Bulboplastis apyrenoidosa]
MRDNSATLLNQSKNKNLLKIITGITNFNIQEIMTIVKAAEISQASYIDIAADKNLIQSVKQMTNLPICVSLIDPNKVTECILAGADLLEVGNFNFLYQKEFAISSLEIVRLCDKIRNIAPNINLCVTIPHFFSLKQQVKLSIILEELGIDMIQTEGYPIDKSNGINRYITSISQTLSSTYVISQYVNIPIITSSSLSYLNVPMAQKYGASGIGIGTSIAQLQNMNSMVTYMCAT